MRILTVSHFYESHGGGIERVAGHLCRQFNALGSSAVWAASASDDPPDGIEVVPLACINPTERLLGLPAPIPLPSGCRALVNAVRQSDAVFVHDALYATSILAMLTAKRARKPVVLIQHIAAIPFSSALLRGVMKAANRLVTGPMLEAAHGRVFISDMVRRDLLGDAPRLDFALLFNGVDGRVFHPGERRLPPALAKVGASLGRKQLLFVGRYVEKKGLSILRRLAEIRPELDLMLVGTGPMRPTEWGLPNVFDLGRQTPTQLADLYRWADLLVLPSVGEGFPLVIQEAMACGLPVLCGAPTHRADPSAARWICGVDVDLSQPGESAWRCSLAIDDLHLTAADRADMARYAHTAYNWARLARSLLRLAGADA